MSTDEDEIDWSLATWEGANREKLRRWRKLTLEQILRAQEEMWDLAVALGHDPGHRNGAPAGERKGRHAGRGDT